MNDDDFHPASAGDDPIYLGGVEYITKSRSDDLVAAERERCARVSENFGCCHVPQEIAAAIREGGGGRVMPDITHKAPERIEIESECGHANRYNSEDRKTLLRGPDDAPDYFCGEYVRADLMQAAVAAALTEAAAELYKWKDIYGDNAARCVLALIPTDAQAALDRYVKQITRSERSE